MNDIKTVVETAIQTASQTLDIECPVWDMLTD